MPNSAPVDDFRLAYNTVGSGPAVVLLHGWPGDRTDWREVVPLLAEREVVGGRPGAAGLVMRRSSASRRVRGSGRNTSALVGGASRGVG